MRDVEWVAQEDAYGCTIAALAMILGRTYEDVKAEIVECVLPAAFNCGSVTHHCDTFLQEHGFAVARAYRFRYDKEREAWPPEPFSDVHLCRVVVNAYSETGHHVVMLGDGSVLDPLFRERRRLTDYYCVDNVAAVVGMGGAAE